MAKRTGSANLPLHNGRVPAWLASRMAALGRVIAEAIIHHYGRDEFLRRLAHPFWFQSFGAVMGMDWHSSGITTSVLGALKRGLSPLEGELGLYICGGRGRHSLQTPVQLARVGERTGLDSAALAQTSRLVAKIDNAAVQDGYDLYLHAFVVAADGHWCVVQQGMNTQAREARRYHWLSEGLVSFLDSPHAAIEGRNQGAIINLADARAKQNRRAGLELVHGGPQRPIALLRRLRASAGNAALALFPELEASGSLPEPQPGCAAPHLHMPAHHEVLASDVQLRRLHATLAAAADRGPKDFAELLLTPGVGARTVAALAFVAEVIYGVPARFSDPARFSFAHGGKDRHPFPVALKVYDETLRVMKDAVSKARLGNSERLSALRRLDSQVRALERNASGPQFSALLSAQRASSQDYGGRSVFRIE
ncbi:MAG: DUF763 domain-containing protein [Steroidobacteraceae bacterium]|jgi:hypothetical protein